MRKGGAIREFWQAYVNELADDHPHRALPVPEVWSFGDDPEMADELGELMRRGVKTATCCRYLGESLVDDVGPSIGVDGRGRPLCVVETVELTVRRFRDVDAAFAKDEGEGDGSLSHWRRAHGRFFTREGAREGYEVSEDMLLECERYRVLYTESRAAGPRPRPALPPT